MAEPIRDIARARIPVEADTTAWDAFMEKAREDIAELGRAMKVAVEPGRGSSEQSAQGGAERATEQRDGLTEGGETARTIREIRDAIAGINARLDTLAAVMGARD